MNEEHDEVMMVATVDWTGYAHRIMGTHMLPAMLLPMTLVLVADHVPLWVSAVIGLAIGVAYYFIAAHALDKVAMFSASVTRDVLMGALEEAGALKSKDDVSGPKP